MLWMKITEWVFWIFRIRPYDYNSRHYLDWWYVVLMLVGYPYMAVLLYMFFVGESWLWSLSPLINGEFGINIYDGTIAAYTFLNVKEKCNGCGNGKKRAGRWMIFWWFLTALTMIGAMIFWLPFSLEGPPATALTNFSVSLLTSLYSRSKNILKTVSKQ